MTDKTKRLRKWMRGGKLLLVLGGVLAAGWWYAADANKPDYRFKTQEARRGPITQTVTANGTLNPVQVINIGTQVSGNIVKLHVEANDEVEKDQVLAELDPALLNAQLAQSESNYEIAKANLHQAELDTKRMRTLFEKDYIARTELEKAEQSQRSARNSFEVAKAQLETARVNLAYTVIRSPVPGVIIQSDVTEGQTVAASFQTPNLFKIARDLTQMQIDVNLAESDVGRVKQGLAVTFTVDAFPDRQFDGKVEKIRLNPNTTQSVVTYNVTVSVSNPDKILLPGMTAYVHIVVSEKEDVLLVSGSALRFKPPVEKNDDSIRRLLMGKPFAQRPRRENLLSQPADPAAGRTIYLLKDGAPVPVEVKIGIADSQTVEVIEGDVKAGDQVITGLLASEG